MIKDRTLNPSEIMKLSQEDRLSYIRQQIGQEQEEHQAALVAAENQQHHNRVGHDLGPARNIQHLLLSDEEIGLIYSLLDERESKAIATRDRTSSYSTKDKQRHIIDMIEHIRTQLTDQ